MTPSSLRHCLSQTIRALLSKQAESLWLAWQLDKQMPFESWQQIWTGELVKLLSSQGLKRVRRGDTVRYQWAIAPRLSPILAIPAVQLAQDLVTCLNLTAAFRLDQENLPTGLTIWSQCFAEIYGSHLIQLEVSDRALAIWLQAVMDAQATIGLSHDLAIAPLIHTPMSISLGPHTPADLVPLHIIHARCASLLRLGEREGSITLSTSATEDGAVRITKPHPLPWLAKDGRLRLSAATERRLLNSWINLLDQGQASPGQVFAFCNDVYAFDAACRILHSGSDPQPEQAHVRLGLILLVQQYLREILTTSGVEPLLEL